MISDLKLARLRKISAHNAYLVSRPLDVKARELEYKPDYVRSMVEGLTDRASMIVALGTPTQFPGRTSSYCITDHDDMIALADVYLRELADAAQMMMAAE